MALEKRSQLVSYLVLGKIYSGTAAAISSLHIALEGFRSI